MIVAATLGEVSQECEGGTEQVHGHQHKAEDDPEVGESQVEKEKRTLPVPVSGKTRMLTLSGSSREMWVTWQM